MKQLRKQVDMLGGGLRSPIALHVFAGENNLLETWNVRLTQHTETPSSKNPTYSMSKTLLELSIFLRSLQSLVGVLPASIRSNRNHGESYNIILSKAGKKTFKQDAEIMKYQFKSLNSILGAFEVEVVYRKNAVEYQQQIMQSTHGSSPSLKSGPMENKADNATKHTTVPGPVRLTRVSSNPREIPQNNRSTPGSMGVADPAMNYQQAFVRSNEINQSPVYSSSYAEGTTRQRRFGSFGEKYV
jgi:hypothetical protein